MNASLEALVESLLYEGYALYPYTPGTTKNATPTPFGIIYPPAYAERSASTFDHLRVECVLAADEGATVAATVRFLHAAGERHAAVERRVEITLTGVSKLATDRGVGAEFDFEADQPLTGRIRLRAEELDVLDGEGRQLVRVRCCVHNTTELDSAEALRFERPDALLASLLSTHVVLEATGGRFVSPLERDGIAGAAVAGCANVNTWPVLAGATPGDSAVLAAPIVLPEHPSVAPQSLGNLFDNTEIEEALLLHVQVLSDAEREAIEAQDPAVREMIERATKATPEEMISLHGGLTPLPPDPGPPAEIGHPNPGEPTLELDGVTFRKGGKVVLRPGTDRDVYDRMLDGRKATIERLYIDYEDGAHVAVTIDDDPAQELFRETGRYLFFKAGELEVASE